MEGHVVPSIPLSEDVLLGEGIYYKNKGEVDEAVLTHTAGGSEYIEEIVLIDPVVDGVYGPTRSLKRHNTRIPRFMINMGKLTYDTMFFALPSTQSDAGGYYSTRLDLSIDASDVENNITFVGSTHNGEEVDIKISNVLNDGNLEFEFKEKTNVFCKMQYTGYSNDGITIPSEIHKYE